MKFFKTHQSQEEYEEYIDIKEADEIGYPRVDLIGEEGCAYLESKPPHDYSQDYLTVEALEDGIIDFSGPAYGYNFQQNNITSVSYSTNGGKTWITETDFSEQIDIVVQVRKGDRVLWKGIAKQYGDSTNDISIGLSSSKTVNISGNIMSMIWGDDFKTNSEFKENTHDVFYGFISDEFHGYSQVIDASNLILPAINLVTGCYQSLFSECDTLEIPPRLPSINLAERCYSGMFLCCYALKEAPDLPATTVANYCYSRMFYRCSSLENAPQLPATTLAQNCYENMFVECTELAEVPTILPATTLANTCYCGMFAGCTSLATTPELPATTLTTSCYASMFSLCTSLQTAPELPATTLAQSCYASMFTGCSSLTSAPELPAVTLINNCYNTMFYGCTSLNYIKALFTTTPSSTYTVNWVQNVAASGTFIKNPNASWTTTGNNGVPSGWTAVNEVEYLQPNGQAYIDTGITLPDRIKFRYKFSTHVQYGFFFGNYVSENHNTFRVIDSSNGNGNLLLYPNTRAGSGATSIPVGDLNTVHTIDMSQERIEYDEIVFSGQINTTQGTDNNTNLVIFANKSGGSVQNLQHRIYFFQIWKNNELVRDLIPVRQGSTGYMYDKVSNQLFGNAGSGSFTLGSDITPS